jgi:gliding motility-associated-like protein
MGKQAMKKSSYLFIHFVLICLVFIPLKTRATQVGGEITYQWVSDSTYRFFFRYYRDCSGTAEPDTQYLCAVNPCNPSFNFTSAMPKWTGTLFDGMPNGSPVAAACPGSPTQCQNPSSTIKNYREWWYSKTITLPARCNNWRFVIWIVPRTTSNNLQSGNFYVEAVFNNAAFQGNSSPFFSIRPVANICINQPYTFNAGVIDPNGDSLVTEPIIPLTSGSCTSTPSVLFFQSASPSYNIPGNPFQTNNSFTVDPVSGKYDFTPIMAGPNTLTMRVREFRNGVMIGYIMRDMQLNVSNSCNKALPTLTFDPISMTFSSYLFNRMNGCVGQSFDFCFDIKSADTTSRLIASDNRDSVLPTASLTYAYQGNDSVRGCFSWIPAAADTGLTIIVIKVKDSTCNPPGISLNYALTMPLYVWPPIHALKDTTICPGSSTQLKAANGFNISWYVIAGGSPISSLSCTACTNPIATPGVTTQYIAADAVNTYCTNSKDTITVTVVSAPIITPVKDTTTCPNTPVKLDLKPTPPTGTNYTYKWTPSTFLNSDVIADPIASAKSPITYIAEISVTSTLCKFYDTVNVDVLSGFNIFSNDTAVCTEMNIPITGTGDSRYTYLWTTLCPGAFLNPNNTINTIIMPPAIGKCTYVLKASYTGCIDSVDSVIVDVQPIPFVNAGQDISLCFGFKTNLKGIVNPSNYPYSIMWVPSKYLNSATILNPQFSADSLGTRTYTLIASSTGGCADTDQVNVTVFSQDFLKLSTNDTSICAGDSIQLHLTGNNLKAFAWYPNFNISDPISYDPFVSPTATQVYVAKGVDSNSCTDSQVVKITVKPAAMIYLPDSAKVYPGEYYTMDPDGNCLYFSWFPAEGLNRTDVADPKARPDTTMHYIVTGRTEFGCLGKDSIDLIVMHESVIDIPNAFTPKAFTNNVFKPSRLGKVTILRFAIYNRWGQKIFETNKLDEGWDGKFNGEWQPVGVYVYTIEAVKASGYKFSKQGTVTLLR